MFPYEQNSYFTIVEAIHDIILLYFSSLISGKILTNDELFELHELLLSQTNDRFRATLQSKTFNMIYDSSKDGLGRDMFVDNVHDKENILVLIHSKNNNVFGGFTSVGWKNGVQDQYFDDDQAFIFGIRSSRGHEPELSYIKQESSQYALYVYPSNYCWFGKTGSIAIHKYGTVYAWNPESYHSFSKDFYLLGGNCNEVIGIECFQLI